MASFPSIDVSTLVGTMEMSKDYMLQLIQTLCKRLSSEGDEMMFMTMNLNQKNTTCIGSQLGVNFLNHAPPNTETENKPSVSQMFQYFIEDHYKEATVNKETALLMSPASSVIMESPSYTPYSSPRSVKGISDKLLTPKVEVVDTDYDSTPIGSPVVAASTTTSHSTTLSISTVLKGLLTSSITGPKKKNFPPYIPRHNVTVPPVIRSSANQQPPLVPSQFAPIRPAPVPVTFQPQTPGTTNVRARLNNFLKSQSTPSPGSSSVNSTPTSLPTSNALGNETPVSTTSNKASHTYSLRPMTQAPPNQKLTPINVWANQTQNIPTPVSLHRIPRKRGRPKGKERGKDNSDESSSETESDDMDQQGEPPTMKTVTLRSGRQVKVPSWRQEVLEDNLKNNRKMIEDIGEVKIKEERITPPPTDDGVRVEFDFDILADLKKEPDFDNQSENSSWSGTVQLTSGDDSTPNKVPFQFRFGGSGPQGAPVTSQSSKSGLSDQALSSVGLARKPKPFQPITVTSTESPVVPAGRFDYIVVFEIVDHEGAPHFRCKLCQKILPYSEGLKNHCFSHNDFIQYYPVCEACDKLCESHQDLICHISTHITVFSCHICQEKFTSKILLIQHLNCVHKELYSCPKCNSTFITSRGLRQHLEKCFDQSEVTKAGARTMNENWVSVQDDGKIAFKCRSCQISFDSVESYNQHMLQHKSKFVRQINEKFENSASSQNTEFSPVSKKLKDEKDIDDRTCHICSTIFETSTHLENHLKTVHDNEDGDNDLLNFKCSICHIYFDTQMAFSNHCTTKHPDINLGQLDNLDDYPCKICSKRTKTKEGYELHMKMHENDGKKQCNVCGTQLNQETSEELHCCLKNGSEFKCEKCCSSFYSQSFLSGHLQHVHNVPLDTEEVEEEKKTPKCTFCGKTFKRWTDLQSHKTIHTGTNPHKCHLCSKAFRLRSTLKTHLMTHRDYHEFMCEVCGRTFKLIESLRLHRRLHNTSCYFKCKHCTKEFRAYDGLKYHMLRAHKEAFKGEKLKVYKCEYCNKVMATHQQYVRHVSIHTNEKPLKCDQCETRWATISQLNAHKKKHDADNLKFNCDLCKCKFPILSKLRRHIQSSKHIENCKIHNLPISTTTLEPDSEQSQNSTRVISEGLTDAEEKVEIMFYEINLPGGESTLNEQDSSMIYNIVTANNQNAVVYQDDVTMVTNNIQVEADDGKMENIEGASNGEILNSVKIEQVSENSLTVEETVKT